MLSPRLARYEGAPGSRVLICTACKERGWHGDAIARVLEAHGELAGRDRLSSLREHLGWRDRLRPWLFATGSALAPQLSAVNMSWGAVNEWTTQAAYGRLAAKAGHSVLTELLRRIMRQEGRHIDFYAGQARRMLSVSSKARQLARFALRRAWAPVGSGVMPDVEVAFLVRHLFGDTDGVATARRVDRQVDRLPGLDGLHLLERAAGSSLTA